MESLISVEDWHKIRKTTSVVGLGILQCGQWCDEVEGRVKGFLRRIVVVGDIQIDQYATSELSHHWLEKVQEGGVIVADGTAGQFDPEFPEGYYGKLEDAPPKLRTIYFKYNH